jgi:hypothetical protein
MNRLRPLEHWNRGFESHSCVRLFCVRGVLCVGSGLATGWSSSKKFYRLCIGLRNWKSGQGPKGCRAIERERGSYCVTVLLVQLGLAYLLFTLPLKNDLLSDPYSFQCSYSYSFALGAGPVLLSFYVRATFSIYLYTFAPKMEVANWCETLVTIYHTTRLRIQKNNNLVCWLLDYIVSNIFIQLCSYLCKLPGYFASYTTSNFIC